MLHRLDGRTALRNLLGLALPLLMSSLPMAAAAQTDVLATRVDPQAFAVASPYRISPSARAGTIRYRVSFDPAMPWVWPETGEQHAQTDGGTTVLTVCKTCGREAAPTPAQLQGGRQANAWVDSDDRRVRAFARTVTGGNVDRIMLKLVEAVRRHMSGAIEYRDYQRASQALRSRKGDCTESAVLLAAAARARGIPVRVVAGLAYASRFVGTPHAFGPHMWVQAWDGQRWTSYDAGLGAFDAGHLALALGDGAPDGFAKTMAAIARLRIESAEGVVIEEAPAR